MLTISSVTLSNCSTMGEARRTEVATASVQALESLYRQNESAANLGKQANAVLVFPAVTRAGFMFGKQRGDGVAFGREGSAKPKVEGIEGFYRTQSISYGIQAGAQRFGYAVFLMDEAAAARMRERRSWDLGSSPSVVVFDQGMAGGLSTGTVRSGTYAFFFDQQGVMAGLGMLGTKVWPVN
ncbi:twin-arginine translocation pathway signal protein [Haloferula sp.]|uniref:lipid-binding SYLF domain-containing protein n=1 Tax=Haloferula sp. TaxID=2497595 RepID=UPI00329B8B69